jgi:peptidoglycan hydrolase CwlO-like protein
MYTADDATAYLNVLLASKRHQSLGAMIQSIVAVLEFTFMSPRHPNIPIL